MLQRLLDRLHRAEFRVIVVESVTGCVRREPVLDGRGFLWRRAGWLAGRVPVRMFQPGDAVLQQLRQEREVERSRHRRLWRPWRDNAERIQRNPAGGRASVRWPPANYCRRKSFPFVQGISDQKLLIGGYVLWGGRDKQGGCDSDPKIGHVLRVRKGGQQVKDELRRPQNLRRVRTVHQPACDDLSPERHRTTH